MKYLRWQTGVWKPNYDADVVVFLEEEPLPDDGLDDPYPSAYQPPPLSSKEQRDMILGARLPHRGHLIDLVSMRTNSSMTSPQRHSNS